jgi:hypothetical protein
MIAMDLYYKICYKIIYKIIMCQIVQFNLNLDSYLHRSTRFNISIVLNSLNPHKISTYNYVTYNF